MQQAAQQRAVQEQAVQEQAVQQRAAQPQAVQEQEHAQAQEEGTAPELAPVVLLAYASTAGASVVSPDAGLQTNCADLVYFHCGIDKCLCERCCLHD